MVAQLVKKCFHNRLPLIVHIHLMNPVKTTIRMQKLVFDIAVTAAIKQLMVPDYAVTLSLAVTLLLALRHRNRQDVHSTSL
jgi:hypothetical protein